MPTKVLDFDRRLRDWSWFGALFVGLVAVYAIVSRGWWAFTGPALGIVVGAGIVGLLGDHDRAPTPRNCKLLSDPKIGLSLALFYAVAVIVSYYHVEFSRPLVHYALIGIVTASVSIQILNGVDRTIILIQVLIIGFATYWSSQIAYPAGAFNVDTKEFLTMISTVVSVSGVSPEMYYSRTPVHQVYVAVSVLIWGTKIQFSYIFLATLLLTLSVIPVALLDRVVSPLSKREALFSAFIYMTASFTIGRGLAPHKSNFFRFSILLIVFLYFRLKRSGPAPRLFLSGLLIIISLIAGHSYSAGILAIILISLELGNGLYSRRIYTKDYDGRQQLIVLTLLIMFISYSMYVFSGGGIVRRVAAVVQSVFGITGGGTTGGRYSNFDLTILFFSTVSQFILYSCGVAGILLMFQENEIDFDNVVIWVLIAAGMMLFSLLINAFQIPVQRIHGILAAFGLNIGAAISIIAIDKKIPEGISSYVVPMLMIIFVVFSLASPVAMVSLSPVADDIPQFRQFETEQSRSGSTWESQYLNEDALSMEVPRSEVPIVPIGQKYAVVDRDAIPTGKIYVYNDLAAKRGIILENRPTIGGRTYRFTNNSKSVSRDSQVYSNGGVQINIKQP